MSYYIPPPARLSMLRGVMNPENLAAIQYRLEKERTRISSNHWLNRAPGDDANGLQGETIVDPPLFEHGMPFGGGSIGKSCRIDDSDPADWVSESMKAGLLIPDNDPVALDEVQARIASTISHEADQSPSHALTEEELAVWNSLEDERVETLINSTPITHDTPHTAHICAYYKHWRDQYTQENDNANR